MKRERGIPFFGTLVYDWHGSTETVSALPGVDDKLEVGVELRPDCLVVHHPEGCSSIVAWSWVRELSGTCGEVATERVSEVLGRAGLADSTARLGADELRVLGFSAARLVCGREAYGALDLATDRRDWVRERDEEAADLLVYAACEALRRGAAR